MVRGRAGGRAGVAVVVRKHWELGAAVSAAGWHSGAQSQTPTFYHPRRLPTLLPTYSSFWCPSPGCQSLPLPPPTIPDVFTHRLYSRRYPFWSTDELPSVATVEEMAELVSSVPIHYDVPPFSSMSPEGLDFIRRCLERDEDARLGAAQAMQHPWIQAAMAAQGQGQHAAQAC